VLDGKNLLDPVAVRRAGLHYFGVGISPEPLYLRQARATDSAPKTAAQTDHMDCILVTGGASHTQHAEQT
jgi:hypothetical protein